MAELPALAIFLGSLALSVISSVVLANNIDKVGVRLRLSESLLGIIMALGADAPEVSTAVTALIAGRRDVGLGVVLGSNIFNLAALLGLSAVVAGHIPIRRGPLLFNGAISLLVTVLGVSLVFGWLGAVPVTLLLVALLAPYVALYALNSEQLRRLPGSSVLQSLQNESERGEQMERGSSENPVLPEDRDARVLEASPADALSLVPALVSIVLASIGMVNSAGTLAGKWGIPDHVTGMLVLAALTGIPNVLAAVRLALRGRGRAVVSESLNSNSLNVLSGIALPALVLGLGPASGQTAFGAWWLMGMTIVVVALAAFGGGLRRREGAFVIVLYLVFVGLVIFWA